MNQKKAESFANPKLEKILLGGLFRSSHLLWEIEHAVRKDTFSLDLHREIFEHLYDMIRAGQAVTLPVLCGRLPDEAKDANGNMVSVRSYLSVCIHEAEEVSAKDVYEDLAELASLRQLQRVIERANKEINRGDRRSDEIAMELEASALDIMRVVAPKRPKRLSEVAKTVIKKARVARDEGVMPGLTTGLAALDEIMGMIFPTDLIGFLAASSDGKTTMVQQIGMHISKTQPVLMIQMEMSDEQVAVREVSAASGINQYAIQAGAVNAFDYELVEEAGRQIEKHNFWVHDAEMMTVREIKHLALGMQKTGGLGAIIVDQLDKVRGEGRYRSEFDLYNETLRDLKNLAKSIRVPILLPVQRTRKAQREHEVPMITDASVGPALEHNCDTVIGLWRRENWLQNTRPDESREIAYGEWKQKLDDAREHAEIIALKRRSGKRFVRRQLRWNGGITRFEDI